MGIDRIYDDAEEWKLRKLRKTEVVLLNCPLNDNVRQSLQLEKKAQELEKVVNEIQETFREFKPDSESNNFLHGVVDGVSSPESHVRLCAADLAQQVHDLVGTTRALTTQVDMPLLNVHAKILLLTDHRVLLCTGALLTMLRESGISKVCSGKGIAKGTATSFRRQKLQPVRAMS